MKNLVERQRWVASFALLAAVPLPLTGVVTWPFVAAYLATALAVVFAPRPLRALPAWIENVLAPLILVAVLAAGGFRFGVLRPVAQLALLLASVRLIGCGEGKRTRNAFGVLTLVCVAGIASSTHPTLVVYLVVLLVVGVIATARFNHLAWSGPTAPVRGAWMPPARVLVATAVIALVAAVPIFAMFPRLRSPFAGAPVGGRAVSGYRGAVSLNRVGDIQLSQARALTVRFPDATVVQPSWMYLAGTTARRYNRGTWAEGRRGPRVRPDADGVVRLAGDARGATVRAEVALEKPSDTLFLPPGAAILRIREAPPLYLDPGGSVRLRAPIVVSYGVDFVAGELRQPPPGPEDLELPQALAAVADVAAAATTGATNALARANRIEQFLQQGFAYTTGLRMDRPSDQDPVLWFLFEGRRGHCEFFATAMAMMLRSQGVPARLQVGYLGGEPDGDGGFVVRDSNAHAWVVAWAEGGWRVFDPTPPAGRPVVRDLVIGNSLALAWQRLEGLWDRWVLTLSLVDQVELLRAVVAALAGAGGWFATLAVVAAGVLIVVLVLRRRGGEPDEGRPRRGGGRAARALRRIGAAARAAGLAGEAELTPRMLARAVEAGAVTVAIDVRWLVAVHETNRYGGGVAPAWAEVSRRESAVLRAIAAAGRRRRLARESGPATPGRPGGRRARTT